MDHICRYIFFNVFPHPLYAGNPAEDLVLPGQVFVSAKFAQKMFGDRQAVGQELVTGEGSWMVTGIFEIVPENTICILIWFGHWKHCGKAEVWIGTEMRVSRDIYV